MAKFIHTMMRVRDLDASLSFYADVVDMQPSLRLDFPAFSLVYLRNPETDSEIELTWNKEGDAPYSHGDGYGHVAFAVDDVAVKHAQLLGQGRDPLPIKEFRVGEELLARFFFILDPDGYKLEILEKHGHYG